MWDKIHNLLIISLLHQFEKCYIINIYYINIYLSNDYIFSVFMVKSFFTIWFILGKIKGCQTASLHTRGFICSFVYSWILVCSFL